MHVKRFARRLDEEMQRHPGVRREPIRGNRLDARVRGNDHDAARAVC